MRKLAIFSFSFAAAAAAYVYFLPPRWALYLAACLAPAALLPIKRAVRLRIGAFGLAVGFLWSWGYERLRIYPLREYCGYATELSATVCAAPEETDGGCRTVVRIGDGKLLLYLNCPPQSVRIGDRVHVWARVEDVSRGTQDKERNLYYPSCDISLVGFAHGEAEIVPQSPALRDLPAAAAVRVRERITKLFPPDVEGFLRGLLTGDRSGMSYELRNRLSLTGLSHVVSVSGMHVSLLFGVLLALCRRRRALTVLLSVPLLTFFAAMLGFTPSVTRAVVMNTIVLCAPLAGREEDQPTTLGFALLVILLANPWAIANVSLQLSFLAMAGIFLFAGPMHRRLCGLLPKALQKSRCLFARALRAVLLIVSVSMSVQTVSLPLAAWYFGMVSLLAPLTNLLCVSLIAAVFTLSCGVLALSLAFSAARLRARERACSAGAPVPVRHKVPCAFSALRGLHEQPLYYRVAGGDVPADRAGDLEAPCAALASGHLRGACRRAPLFLFRSVLPDADGCRAGADGRFAGREADGSDRLRRRSGRLLRRASGAAAACAGKNAGGRAASDAL